MTSDERAAGGRPHVVRSVELHDGRRLVVRAPTIDDVDDVLALYDRLSPKDLHRRFFTKHKPSRAIVEEWMSPDRAGAALIAEVIEDGETALIGEAGYSLLGDGDGELAITVDQAWRGWFGSWLLDALVEEAAARGVPNLHADVLLLNRPMVAVLRHRGAATVDHPDLGQVRLVIGTTGPAPGWAPRRTRPRLLVEGVSGMWWGEQLARDAGFDVRICAGPGTEASRCPVLRGEDCPLVDGADAVVAEFAADDPLGADIVDHVRCRRPEVTIVVPSDLLDDESPIELIDDLWATIADDT